MVLKMQQDIVGVSERGNAQLVCKDVLLVCECSADVYLSAGRDNSGNVEWKMGELAGQYFQKSLMFRHAVQPGDDRYNVFIDDEVA